MLVSVVRIRPATLLNQNRVDILDYKNPRIWAIIPGWLDKNGVITSLKTGKPVKVRGRDSVREERVGAAFNYDDGSSVIYTRGWHNGVSRCYLTEKTCGDAHCISHRAFGEELERDPEAA